MDDIIHDFIAESKEGLEQVDNDLIKLEKDPNDIELLKNIFRIMHTIKGTCGFIGLPKLEKVAHASENVLGKIRDSEIKVTANAITAILESVDVVKDIVDYLEQNGSEPDQRLHYLDRGAAGQVQLPQPVTPLF